MIDWFLGLPWVLIAVLISGGFSAFAVVGLSFARRWILPRFGHSEAQNDVTGLIHHGTLIIYGLAVALLAVAVWENNAEVTKIVSAEAAAIAASYRDADGYPEPTRSHLRAELVLHRVHHPRSAGEQRKGKSPRRRRWTGSKRNFACSSLPPKGRKRCTRKPCAASTR
jgi:hypothetical protein